MPFDVEAIRRQFPLLKNNPSIAYLDGAATSQKPQVVIDAMSTFLETSNANVHRGMHQLAEQSTEMYEEARKAVATFMHAKHPDEIIFTKSATESINLVARSYGDAFLREGDAVLLSLLEHHSNVIPWMQLRERNGIDIRWIDIDGDGNLDIRLIQSAHLPVRSSEAKAGSWAQDGRVKMVSITGLSNVLGTTPPLKEMIAAAHEAGAVVLVDASQMAAHMPMDVQDLDCDFLAFSGHKIYGPTGIGVLYGKRELLKKMPPFLGGGMMIENVTRDAFTPADAPAKFEAGTPPLMEAVGLKAALEWQSKFSWKDRSAHEQSLLKLALTELSTIPHLHILGPGNAEKIHGCVSFTVDGVHPHDLTQILGEQGICLRAGHHCAQPLHERLGIPASTRLSVSLCNNEEDVLRVAPAINEAMKKLAP